MTTYNWRASKKDPDQFLRPPGTEIVVTESPYADGDLVPADDGEYRAVGASRPLPLNPGEYVTTIRRVD